MKKTEDNPADIVRAERAQRQTLTTSAGDAGTEVPDRDRPIPESEVARKLKRALGIPVRSDPVDV
jgi:hypothetical protein